MPAILRTTAAAAAVVTLPSFQTIMSLWTYTRKTKTTMGNQSSSDGGGLKSRLTIRRKKDCDDEYSQEDIRQKFERMPTLTSEEIKIIRSSWKLIQKKIDTVSLVFSPEKHQLPQHHSETGTRACSPPLPTFCITIWLIVVVKTSFSGQ